MTDAHDLPPDPGRKPSWLDGIIRFCLENKLVVALALAVVVAWGVAVAPFDWQFKWVPRDPVPVDAIPDTGENQQIVFTDWMGHSPQDVEDQITYPLVRSLLGMPGVKTVRSTSAFGFSSIYVIFDEKVEFYWSRTRVLERLNSLPAGTLPEGVQPTLGPDATALGQVYWYTLEGRDPDGKPAGGWDLQELRTEQDWYVRYSLLSAGGISEVASVGGFVKEYQIDLDPDAMRAYGVTLDQVYNAVRMSNMEVGAQTIELNKVLYTIRGLGYIKTVSDVENTVIKASDGVPILVKNVAHVSLGPAMREGALDKEGAEAVGGVAIVRYGFNPLQAIKNLKAKIAEISPGLRTKAVVDWTKTTRAEVEQFAAAHGFSAFAGAGVDQKAWLAWLRATPRAQWPQWATTSHVTVVPFYDRTTLIYETLGTLNDALVLEILVTIIVVIISVLHLRSSILISAALPLAVLVCFIAMKLFGVDANIVALSGIAIAIGVIVDMSIIVCENILRRLEQAGPEEDRREVIFRATSEVGTAVVTAVSTVVVGFLPVFMMVGPEGKLFRPLAFTKTFALVASVLVALLVVPAGAHVLFTPQVRSRAVKRVFLASAVVAGIVLALWLGWWWAGCVIVLVAGYHLAAEHLPERVRGVGPWVASAVAAAVVGYLLTVYWEPLGPETGLARNLIFVGVLIGGLMGFFMLLRAVYGAMLAFFLRFKLLFLGIPVVLTAFGLWYVWLGPGSVFELVPKGKPVAVSDFGSPQDVAALKGAHLLGDSPNRPGKWEWMTKGLTTKEFTDAVSAAGVKDGEKVLHLWLKTRPLSEQGVVTAGDFSSPQDVAALKDAHLLVDSTDYEGKLRWTTKDMTIRSFMDAAGAAGVEDGDQVARLWLKTQPLEELAALQWEYPDDPQQIGIGRTGLAVEARWTIARDWNGRGKEFMPPLDEGSFLLMPTTMPHASINETLDVLHTQDRAIRAIPEIESVVGKVGRAETSLDPADMAMIETIISYKPEYMTDKDGRRMRFRYDAVAGAFVWDAKGQLIEDPHGRPFRQWRDSIKTPNDIWNAILEAASIPGTTSAPKLQPIEARRVMLQSGMRAPMGVKVKGPDLDSVQQTALDVERLLKEVPTVEAKTVFADRILGKPYLEITPDRQAIARYGINVGDVLDVVETAIGGKAVTTTVEGRERYSVRVRYERELRDQIETLGGVLVPTMGSTQIPLRELADVRYVSGPMDIKSEDGALVGYVLFDRKPGTAEVDVVEECQRYLVQKMAGGGLVLPAGVSFSFAGNYENELHARKTLSVVLPLALMVIFLILYFQFRSVSTALLVFSSVGLAWSGGFMLMWAYGQPWFLHFSVFGVPMRGLFQMHVINMSVAVWVGFLALFGIAVDDGVLIATYLDQSFGREHPDSVEGIREATLAGGKRRIRPCLMTVATAILALIPVLTSVGRGSDVMVPMAIPTFGGMLVVLVSVFTVPVFYCTIKEFRHITGWSASAVAALLLVTAFVPGMAAMMVVTAVARRRPARPIQRGEL